MSIPAPMSERQGGKTRGKGADVPLRISGSAGHHPKRFVEVIDGDAMERGTALPGCYYLIR
jgi:hypothetical protein